MWKNTLVVVLFGLITGISVCNATENNLMLENKDKCPSMEGTYQFEGSPAKFYLKPDGKSFDSYKAVFETNDEQLTEIKTLVTSQEERKKQNIDKCALIIPQVGMLLKVTKGDKFEVLLSQNYVTEKTFTQDYAMMIFAGFGFDAVNVKKINNSSMWDKNRKLITLEESMAQKSEE